MWMPAQITWPPRAVAASAAGTSAPAGAKISAASSGVGGEVSLPPVQWTPSRAANACAASSPGSGERVDGAALRQCDLRDQMRGRPKTVDAEPARVARHRVGAIADQSGTQQRRGMRVVVSGRQSEHVTRIGEREFRVTAVDLISGEARLRTKVLAARRAKVAMAARAAEPRDADTGADRRGVHSFAMADDRPDDLVPRDHRHLGIGQLPVDEMEVGATDAARAHREQDLATRRFRTRQLAQR